MTRDDITVAATDIGTASFMATLGRVPDNFSLLSQHAPAAFAGYGLIRAAIMRDRDEGGALDLKTKELIFALLDTLIGQKNGAKNHAATAMKLGLTLPELSEGLVQVIMAGGITTWNETGADVMRHCVQLEAERAAETG
ncbi:carboxymuconolactone decarboxylase family protein [Bosea sp. (in: a-proteobacteria)]|uniref:carboxymuconolactone decarboxylase family protein n=1 Tax=Bosea sp. (in: a-proteobacteria) TaxID=1871050 RepID=UPI002734C61A|nr:carboxymuconolactone decarboxylase family protein [Bosea sp. (in: a-proteobacteria)]MDP3410960.1 carboxymuconolactone decarboxylase family protein [Bosea sp. (in: a-proteobacteria)]